MIDLEHVPDELVIAAFKGVYGRGPRSEPLGSAPTRPHPDGAVCDFIRKQLAATCPLIERRALKAAAEELRRQARIEAERLAERRWKESIRNWISGWEFAADWIDPDVPNHEPQPNTEGGTTAGKEDMT